MEPALNSRNLMPAGRNLSIRTGIVRLSEVELRH